MIKKATRCEEKNEKNVLFLPMYILYNVTKDNMKRLIAGILLIFLFAGCSQEAQYTETETLELEVSGLRMIEINAGDGDIGIRGVDGSDTISVTGEIDIAGKDSGTVRQVLEKQMDFSLEGRGNTAVLTARFRKLFFLLDLFQGQTRKLNLDVRVPSTIEVVIIDGDGDLYISDIRNDVTVTDNGGKIDIQNVRGDIEVSDHAGSMVLTDTAGKIQIEDKSEDIELEKCSGPVQIVDTTGAIRVFRCTGSLSIEDSGGEIYIEEHEGDVRLKARGRGDIVLKGIRGDLIQNY